MAAQKGYRLILVIPDKMSQEKILHLRALGAQITLTRSDVGQGPSRVLPGPGRAPGARDAQQLLRQSVRQSRQPAGARGDHRAGDLGADRADARCGGGRRGQRRHADRPVALLRARRAARGDGAGRSERLGAGRRGRTPAKIQKPAGSWLVEGIGEDFVPPICDLSRVRRRLRDLRRREFRYRARAAGEGRDPGRLEHRHAGGGGAALLPRADRAQARGHAGAATAATSI